MRILDAGAGAGPYQKLFEQAQYESADIAKFDKHYMPLTYVCDLAHLPVEDSRFDAVLCTQVLEHVYQPREVVTEFNRVLRPGGELWITVPLFFEEHEVPYDFFRYTRFALASILSDSGFDVRSIEWLEGYFGTLSYQCWTAARCLPSYLFPLRVGFLCLAHVFYRLDIRKKFVAKGMCKNYAVIARKPSGAQGS